MGNIQNLTEYKLSLGVLPPNPRLVGNAGVRGGHLVQPGQHPGAHPQGHEEPRQHDPDSHRCRRLPQQL